MRTFSKFKQIQKEGAERERERLTLYDDKTYCIKYNINSYSLAWMHILVVSYFSQLK